MNIADLVSSLKHITTDGWTLGGPFGSIFVKPEQHPNSQTTYWVDSSYRQANALTRWQHSNGLRLSTVCCLCACILVGEKAVDSHMIAAINAYF